MANNNLPDVVHGLTDQPHWRVVVRPTQHDEELIPSLSECLRIVRRASVSLRGRNFPQVGHEEDLVRGSNYVGCAIELHVLEYWRFYQSGQFIHLHTFEECWFREQLEESARWHLGKFGPYRDRDWSLTPGFISIISFLYAVTEVFEFAARLCQTGIYRDGCIIEIGLKQIKGFILMEEEKKRRWSKYCEATEDKLEHSWVFASNALISESAAKALDAVEWFFERFGWVDPNIEGLRTDQHEFLRLTSISM